MPLESLYPYFLVIGVISLMIAPVLWMQPSPRQKQLAALRAKAMALGLSPQIAKRPSEVSQTEADTVAKYSLLLRENRKTLIMQRLAYRPLYKDEGVISGWLDQDDNAAEPAIAQMLSLLPNSSYLVELMGNSVSLYWKEQGEEQDLKIIYSVFSDLLDWYKKRA